MTNQEEERLQTLTQLVRGLATSNYQLRQSNESLTRALGMERAESRGLYDECARLSEEIAKLREIGKATCDAVVGAVVPASSVKALAERYSVLAWVADGDGKNSIMVDAYFEVAAELRNLLPKQRKPPFEWAGEDKAKLVPGASISVVLSGETVRHVFDSFATNGDLRLVGRFAYARLDYCDPQSIEQPSQPGFDANGSMVP